MRRDDEKSAVERELLRGRAVELKRTVARRLMMAGVCGVCGECVVVVVGLVVSGKAEDDVGESKRPPAWLTRKRMGVESGQSGMVRRLGQACEASERSSWWTHALATNKEGSS